MDPITKKATTKYLEGPTVSLDENYGGLGLLFSKTLSQNLNKIHQMDTVTGVTETNGSVRSRAIHVASELRNFGIVENDILLICCRCHADQTVVVLACLMVGAILAPIDYDLHHKQCVELVSQLKPKMCFCDLRTLKQMERVLVETELTSRMVHFGDQQQYDIPFRKLFMSKRNVDQFKPVLIEHPRKRVAFVLSTQGATGTPRLVCLSHHFIYSQIFVIFKAMDAPEKMISYYPLSWVLQVVVTCLCFEMPVVRVLTGPFVERTACKMIQDLKIDHAFLNTDLALQLTEHVAVKDFNLSCLRSVFIGSLATTSQEIKRLVARLPTAKFTQMYTTTEVGTVLACPLGDYEESLERIGTVGKPVQNCKIRIVNTDTRKDVDVETAGELLLASDCMMLGYFKNIGETKSCTQEGFFKTGDIARYDGSGWIFIEGRITDLINVQGLMELPRYLEDVIMMHPFVKDTAAISDDKDIIACVIVKPGAKLDEEKLLMFLSERLPRQKLPAKIVFLNEFPTTSLGEIKRDMLKEYVMTVKIEHSMTHL